ncbi:PTS sugar transporter subunit IIC [Campylobacter upsaliensis]|uniref:PTS sugar transporter subunit IIC n=1 Tax=Campylobacter upsaliensis TaxID=28080 RepID=UPI002B3B40C1|nr:PTS transporter subunit EIIC [Campylobacter upsaliensis]MEB2816695.1 PTS transporter subunit EIIC [Campylobacter upsaliensis]
MKIFDTLNTFMLEKVKPLAFRFENQPHIVAIKNGFIVLLPFLIIGSFMMILLIPPYPEDTTSGFGQAWLALAKELSEPLWRVFQMSFNAISLFACASISFYLAKEYKITPLHTAVLSMMAFLLLCMPYQNSSADITYFGGKGLFVAIFIAFYVTELKRFILRCNLSIKMPKEIPAAVAQSFNTLIPILAVLLTIYPFALLIEHYFQASVPVVFEQFLAPVVQASDSLYTLLILTALIHLLWFFGINGALIFIQLWTPFLLVNLGENLKAFQAGEPLPFVITNGFWDFYVTHGGSGGLISLCILLVLFSKSKLCKNIGRVGIVPVCFSIAEPIIYGLPILLNPIFLVPLLLAPLVNGALAYFAHSLELVPAMVILVPWTTPAPIGAYIASGGSVSAAVLSVLLIILDALIYYPFFRLYDKICQEKEGNGKEITQ